MTENYENSFKIENEQIIANDKFNLIPNSSRNQCQNSAQPWTEKDSSKRKKKLKLNESERRKRLQCLRNIAEYCRVQLNVENIVDTNSVSSSDLDELQESIPECEQTSLSHMLNLNKESIKVNEQIPSNRLLSQNKEFFDGCGQKVMNESLFANEREPKKKIDALLKLQRKRARQQRYREQNREKLKKREAERRKRKQCLQNITAYLKVELNDDNNKAETSLNLEASRISYNERRKESKLEKNRERQKRYRERKKQKLKQLESECLQSPEIIANLLRENNKKKEWQQRYREKNRDKLKQREKDRRKRVQCLQKIADICKFELDNRVLDSNVQSSSTLEKSGLEKFGEFDLEHFAFNLDIQKGLTQPSN